MRLPDAVRRVERYCSGITKWAAHPTPVRLAALDVTAGSKF
ncbi:hypothetical protein RHOER0001_1900 [Rhodococcus erythropolis SK121]|nr:hypothetical protein RHOER0001_1900 [Rhodococcus erythropolis SK121]